MSTESPAVQRTKGRGKLLGALLILCVFGAGMWAAWLGWDTEYYDVDGVAQGPYRPWQVVGCVMCIVLASVAVFLYLQRAQYIPIIALVAVAGFAIPWTINASADTSGLWLVGLILLLVGGVTGLMLVLAVVYVIRTVARKSVAARGSRRGTSRD